MSIKLYHILISDVYYLFPNAYKVATCYTALDKDCHHSLTEMYNLISHHHTL